MILLLLTLLWTNPPDADLARIQIQAVRSGTTDTLTFTPYEGRDSTLGYCGMTCDPALTEPVLRPGQPDSLKVSLPCFHIPQTWYFWLYSFDFDGHRSDQSNIAVWTGKTP